MGKQYDKVIKRRRRLAYLERRKEMAKEAAASANKPKIRKPKAKVEEAPVKEPAPKKAPKPKAAAAPAAEPVEVAPAAAPAPAAAEPVEAAPAPVAPAAEEPVEAAPAAAESNLAEAPATDTASAPAE
jgi:pilus assembly protein FimV